MGSKHNPPRWWKDYEEECRVYNFLSSAYARQVWSGQVVFNAAAAAKLRFMPSGNEARRGEERKGSDSTLIKGIPATQVILDEAAIGGGDHGQ